MHAEYGLGEAVVQGHRFSNRLSRSDEAKPFNHSVFGHVTVPLHHIDKVAVFVGDGGSLPVVPQPHELTLHAVDFDPCPSTRAMFSNNIPLYFRKAVDIIYPNWQALPMFCPQCGTLSFPTPSGDISCTNYKCGYKGPANLKTKIGGKEVDLSKATSSTKVESRDYEVIKDSDNMQGILTTGDYMCPKCDCVEVYAYLEQTRSSDEPETRMLTCKNCGNGWREY